MLSIPNTPKAVLFSICRMVPICALALLISISPFLSATTYGQITQKLTPGKTLENQGETQKELKLPETPEEIREKITQLQEKLSEFEQKYLDAQSRAEASPPDQQVGVTSLATKEARLHQKRIRFIQHQIDSYRILQKIRLEDKELTAEIDAWKGFDIGPPYPLSLINDLRNAIHTKELKIKEIEIDRGIAEDMLTNALELVKKAEEDLRKAADAQDGKTSEADRNYWGEIKGLASLQKEASGIESTAVKIKQLVLAEAYARHKKELTFLERKLQIATEDASFTKEELEAKLSTIDEALKATQTELEKAMQSYVVAQKNLWNARRTLTQTQSVVAETPENIEKRDRDVKRQQQILAANEAEAETANEIVDGLRIMINAYELEKVIWSSRHTVYATYDEDKLLFMSNEIKRIQKRTIDYRFLYESRFKLTQSLIIGQQNRLASPEINEWEKPLAEQMLKTFQKRVNFFERAMVRISEVERLIERWQEEIEWRRSTRPIREQLQNFISSASNLFDTVWSFELFTVEDTFIIDGEPITAKRPITLSKVIRALLILVIGMWIGSLLARRVRSLSIKYLRADQRIGELVEKGFRVAVIILIIIIALVTVKIPLTIFAFLGGALAIGVGFGAQNLINNFISGVILLFERPIKVGDIVEVEGTRGRVVTIGGRCSQIRRFDGIDILVPNSSFLEKNVVNWTLTDDVVRISVSVGVAYGSPTREVTELITKAAKENEQILTVPEPIVLFEDFGDNALIFTVYFWSEVSTWVDFRVVASELRHAIGKNFADAGITIAFPQRDVHFDSPKPIQVQITESPPPQSKTPE